MYANAKELMEGVDSPSHAQPADTVLYIDILESERLVLALQVSDAHADNEEEKELVEWTDPRHASRSSPVYRTAASAEYARS